MNLILTKFYILIALLTSTLAPSWGQSGYRLSFEGMLSDIEGKKSVMISSTWW